jgi:hypothetical protein
MNRRTCVRETAVVEIHGQAGGKAAPDLDDAGGMELQKHARIGKPSP